MLVPKHSRMSADDRRRQLVELGADLLFTDPLDNLTGQRLAELAGTSRGLIFHYFPTVRDLHLACLEESARRLVAAIECKITGVQEDHELFNSVLRIFVSYIGNNPRTFSTLSGYAVADPDFGLAFDTARHRILDIILSRLEPANSSYGPALIAGWIAMVEQSVLAWTRTNPSPEEESVEPEMIEALLGVLEQLSARTLDPVAGSE